MTSTYTDWSPRFRILSALELLLGAFIVIGHNVFHVVPNEVPILFVLGLVSIRLRNGGWSAMGFKRPSSWVRLVLIALAAAALRIILGDFVIEPLTRAHLASYRRAGGSGDYNWRYQAGPAWVAYCLDVCGVR